MPALGAGLARCELAEAVPLVGGERREVHGRLGVGGEHEQALAGRQLREPAAREHERERTREAARVERRHNPIMSPASPRLAAILATGETERLYSGLSTLVSTAAEGVPCAALATFRSLDLLLAEDILRRALEPEMTPSVSWSGRETFARSLLELRETALGLESLSLYACSASVDLMGVAGADVEERLSGVLSTPRFLHEAAEARLLFV